MEAPTASFNLTQAKNWTPLQRPVVNGILWVLRIGPLARSVYGIWTLVSSIGARLFTVDERHESVVFEALTEQGAVKHLKSG